MVLHVSMEGCFSDRVGFIFKWGLRPMGGHWFWWGVFEKNHRMEGCSPCPPSLWETLKIGALIHAVKFLSPEVAQFLYKSIIYPCMEYCCHIWAGASSCYLELLGRLQKWICRTVCLSLAAFVEPLVHRGNVASLSIFYRYYFCRCSSGSTSFFSRKIYLLSCWYTARFFWHFLVPRCYNDIYVNSFFPCTLSFLDPGVFCL